MLKIIFLFNKNDYITKMSRVRIHGILALSKIAIVKVWGLNWEHYDSEKTVQENLDFIHEKPDVVVCYKPLLYKGFNELNCLKVLRYNEMYELELTIKEIEESNADLVVCHHENDCNFYQHFYRCYFGQKNTKVKIVHIPHSAEKTIFKDYGLEKKYDILLVGRNGSRNRLLEKHYPIRDKFRKVIPKLEKDFKIDVFKHPGYVHEDSFTDKYLIEFAKAINQSKVCISCSGLPKSRFGKYVEVPMCGSVLVADLPNEDQENIKKFVYEINENMTKIEMEEKIRELLKNEELYNKLKNEGLKWSQNYTQEKYAERLFKEINQCLS